jgi:hypothetical protein
MDPVAALGVFRYIRMNTQDLTKQKKLGKLVINFGKFWQNSDKFWQNEYPVANS